MNEAETNMLKEYETGTGLRPMLWFRYIDDVFFLWTQVEESLEISKNFFGTIPKPKK